MEENNQQSDFISDTYKSNLESLMASLKEFADKGNSYLNMKLAMPMGIKEAEILYLKNKLYATDYKVIKVLEKGLNPSEEIPDILAERQSYRDRINEIEETE